MKQRQLNLEA
jgi:hypothetical protein